MTGEQLMGLQYRVIKSIFRITNILEKPLRPQAVRVAIGRKDR